MATHGFPPKDKPPAPTQASGGGSHGFGGGGGGGGEPPPQAPSPRSPSPGMGVLGHVGPYNIIDRAQAADGTVVEVLSLPKLEGGTNPQLAETAYFLQETNTTLKMVRITLNGSKVRLEPGALYFMKGQLEMRASSGGGVVKALSRKMLSGETMFVNEITGHGEIYLEPTFGHFLLQQVDDYGAVICDRGLFYAGTSQLDISAVRQKSVTSALFGGEGLFQTKIAGQGVAVLFSPVPRQEIHEYELTEDKLSVDGNFAMMRTESVKFTVEKSSKSLFSTAVSGEGLLQTFTGTGKVWIAPTQGVYNKLESEDGIAALSGPPGSRFTDGNVR